MIGEADRADAAEAARVEDPVRRRVEDAVRREAAALLAYFERRADRADAADLLGETLLVVWRRAISLPQDDEQARMWMFGVARRVLATSRRGAVRRHALADRLRAEALVRPGVAEPHDPSLADALANLDPIDGEIIRLVHWDGFSLADVARHLRRPAGTIRSRYARARATLRAALDPSADIR